MKPETQILTDTAGVTLTLGDHLQAPYLPEKRVPHVDWRNWPHAQSVYVDVTNRRVIWADMSPKLCVTKDAGGKIKDAFKAYCACYGTPSQTAVLAVRDGVVTSLEHVSQKKTYRLDWATGKQVQQEGGRKYAAA